jgi:Sulfatase
VSWTTPVHDGTIDQAEHWVDGRVDLARWAGQAVRLTLRATGTVGGARNVAFWSSPIVSSAPVKPFNVVVMVEDAERADYLSVYGHATPTTPFKDRLMAERGIVFEQAIAQADKTRPSVASFMTSLYPTATGSWHFSDILSDRYLTLAEVLRAQGYVTASFIQNGNAGPYAGIHQGFDKLLDEATLGRSTEGVFMSDRVRGFLERRLELRLGHRGELLPARGLRLADAEVGEGSVLKAPAERTRRASEREADKHALGGRNGGTPPSKKKGRAAARPRSGLMW